MHIRAAFKSHPVQTNAQRDSLPTAAILSTTASTYYSLNSGGARGVRVIVVGNGLGNTSSNPGRDWLHFT